MTSTAVAISITPERKRKSRLIPKVTIYAIHDADCKWHGKSKKITCQCPKLLQYYKGRTIRKSLPGIVDTELVEQEKRSLENQLEAIAKGEDPKPDPKKGKTLEEAIGRLVGFFDFCVEMGWIVRNIAKGKAIAVKGEDAQKLKALSDEQFKQALAAIPRMNGRSTAEMRTKLPSLFLLMRWTGLAIRDALTIERTRFERIDGSYYRLLLHRAKTGEPVFCVLTAALVEEIFRGANPSGRYLFIDAIPTNERDLDRLIQVWGRLFGRVSEVAGLVNEHGEPYHFTSHSMRHTFAFWCLGKGIPTEDIAMLIGDSVEIVAKHYSEWIHGRQERLTQRMIEALK
jgi:integrase